jgi:hypothetical protein
LISAGYRIQLYIDPVAVSLGKSAQFYDLFAKEETEYDQLIDLIFEYDQIITWW